MKRELMVLACVALPAGFISACGNDESSTTKSSDAAPAAEAKKYDMALVTGVAGDEFYVSVSCGAQKAAEAAGATLDVQGPKEFDATLQIPIVNAVLARKPDALLIAVNDQKAEASLLEKAKADGVKVVTVDQVIDSDVPVAQVSSDNLEGGRIAAREMIKQIGGKKGTVLIVSVKPGIVTTDERAKGFQEEIAKQDGLKVLDIQYSDNEPAKAASIVAATLAANPDLVGVFGTNIFAGEGAGTGLRNAGAKGKGVTLIAADATPGQVRQLKEGIVQGLVAQKAVSIGEQGVQQALNALNGEPVEASIATDWVSVTKDNLDDPEVKEVLYRSSC